MDSKKIFFISISARLLLLSLVSFFIVEQYRLIKFDSVDTINHNDVSTELDVVYDSLGFTEFAKASSRGDIEAVKRFIAAGVPMDQQSQNIDARTNISSGNTPLHFALWDVNFDPNYEIAQLLINAGAHVNIANSQGNQSIHTLIVPISVDRRKVLLNLLIKNGAHINAQNYDGETMAHLVTYDGEKDWIDILQKYYGLLVNFNIKNKKGETVLDLAINLGNNIGTQLEQLFKKRVDIIGQNNKVIAKNIEIGAKNIIVKLGDVDIAGRDIMGLTLLMLAVIRDDKQFAQFLIDNHADINALVDDSVANSALHLAMIFNNMEMVKLLMAQPAIHVNIQNAQGDTPLHYVFKFDSYSGADYPTLRKNGARLIFQKELKAKTPAAQQSINIANKKGETPLGVAVRLHAVEFIDFLISEFLTNISKGASNLSIDNENLWSAINLANKYAHQDPVNMLAYQNIAAKLTAQYCAQARGSARSTSICAAI